MLCCCIYNFTDMLETPLAPQGIKPAIYRPSVTLPDPFVFVPITQQEAAKGRAAAKRIVRAHVTRIQHARSSTLSSTQDLQTWTVKPYIHRSSVPIQRKTRTNGQQAKRLENRYVDKSDESLDESKELSIAIVPKLPAGTAGEDPFWTYPVEYQPHLAPIFAHCWFDSNGCYQT